MSSFLHLCPCPHVYIREDIISVDLMLCFGEKSVFLPTECTRPDLSQDSRGHCNINNSIVRIKIIYRVKEIHCEPMELNHLNRVIHEEIKTCLGIFHKWKKNELFMMKH